MKLETKIILHGTLIGMIWMPSVTCTKPLRYDLTREDARFTEPGTLRDHVLRATNDGDFQSCKIMDGIMEVTVTITKGTRRYNRTRYFDLTLFKGIADMVTTAEAEEFFYDDEMEDA